MQNYEYKVVPAPTNGTKSKGVKTAEGRFAVTLEMLMNKMGADGWEFQRAETLPSEERSGLMSKSTTYRNVLVFRRGVEQAVETAQHPVVLPVAEVEMPDEIIPEADPIPETPVHADDNVGLEPSTSEEDQTVQPLVASRD